MGTLETGLDGRPLAGAAGADAPVEFRNRVPAFLWGFSVFWFAMVGAFTWVALVSSPPANVEPGMLQGVLGLFWMAGLVIASMALAAPCLQVRVHPGRIEVRSQYPLRTTCESYRPADLEPAEVVDSVDSDGDPYFCVTVRAADDRSFTLEEGRDRRACVASARRFNRAVGFGPRAARIR